MKTVEEMKEWFKKLEDGKALYVWGMNGDVITEKTITDTYRAYKSNQYNWEYYNAKLQKGAGRIGADCSGAFAPMAGSDNTAAGYYAACIKKGTIGSLPKDTPCMVFKRNSTGKIYHIGWYLADAGQTVAEMASSTLNFRRRSVQGAGWTEWGIPKFVAYQSVKKGWVQEDGGWRFYLLYGINGNRMVINGTGLMAQVLWSRMSGISTKVNGIILAVMGQWSRDYRQSEENGIIWMKMVLWQRSRSHWYRIRMERCSIRDLQNRKRVQK